MSVRQQSEESKRKTEKERFVDREGGRGNEQPGDRRRKKMTK